MRKADIPGLCDWFAQETVTLRSRWNRLSKGASDEDRRWLAEAALVKAWTLFSEFAEWVIYYAVNRNSAQLRQTMDLVLPEHLSLDMIQALFTFERGYLDIRGVEDLVDSGRRYISRESDKNPFKQLDASVKQAIDRALKIRNRIVHESRRSRATYANMIKREYGLMRVPRAGTFLAAPGASGAPRLLDLLDGLEKVGAAISSWVPSAMPP